MPANPHDGSGRELFIRGERWVRDGDKWVPQSILDQFNNGDVDTNDPRIIEQIAPYKISYNEGITTKTTEDRARAGGDASGQDQHYGYKQQIGQAEFDRRNALASAIGGNASTETSPRTTLKEELFRGHMDQLPGVPGLYFNARSNGTFIFKDANGNEIPPNQQLMQAAQAGVQQGYGTGAPVLNPDGTPRVPGGAQGPATPPTLPPAPGAPQAPVKPQGPIFSNSPNSTGRQQSQPQLPPAPVDVASLTKGVSQLPGTMARQPMGGAPGMETKDPTSMIKMAPNQIQPVGETGGIKMPDFAKIAGGGTGPALPKMPGIGKASSSFKIG